MPVEFGRLTTAMAPRAAPRPRSLRSEPPPEGAAGLALAISDFKGSYSLRPLSNTCLFGDQLGCIRKAVDEDLKCDLYYQPHHTATLRFVLAAYEFGITKRRNFATASQVSLSTPLENRASGGEARRGEHGRLTTHERLRSLASRSVLCGPQWDYLSRM